MCAKMFTLLVMAVALGIPGPAQERNKSIPSSDFGTPTHSYNALNYLATAPPPFNLMSAPCPSNTVTRSSIQFNVTNKSPEGGTNMQGGNLQVARSTRELRTLDAGLISIDVTRRVDTTVGMDIAQDLHTPRRRSNQDLQMHYQINTLDIDIVIVLLLRTI
ncbi:hypothetical protein BDN72DRAFT_878407 [Pluteus cervinus]|uniref:Uncharacterized protein n=1 Tax=Pluteus cervinus TaxID=181527 RepID=A0ACD3AVC8_9AGAR|nr:hypothetical protein BDN72DRAFT_878407 [Pluteus cervinus]